MDDRYVARRNQELSQRELQLLDIVIALAASEGLHRVSPGEVAKRSNYSRATVYKMWSSREDLLASCAIRSIEMQTAMYKHILPQWDKQVPALFVFSLAYLWHVQKKPTLFHLSLIGRSNENLAGCTPETKQRRLNAEKDLARLIMSVAEVNTTEDDYRGEIPILDAVNAIRAMLTGFGLFSTKIGTSAWKEGLTDIQTSRVIVKTMSGLGWNTEDLNIDSIRVRLRKQLEELNE